MKLIHPDRPSRGIPLWTILWLGIGACALIVAAVREWMQ